MARKTRNLKRGPVLRKPRPMKVSGFKPDKFADYLTLGELAFEVGKDKDWLRKLERRGTIPPGIRHRVGKIEVRLYPPSRVREIEAILKTLRPGRPRKGGS